MTDDTGRGRSNRRTFLQSMAAVTVGAAAVGEASAQQSIDAYHQALQDDLTTDEGLPEGEYVYGVVEQTTIDTFSLAGGSDGIETQFDVSADVPITVGDRIEIAADPANAYDYTYTADVTDRSFSEGDALLAVVYLRGVGTASSDTPVETQAGFKWRYTTPEGSTGFSSNMVAGTARVSPGDQWQRYYFPIEVGAKPDGSDYTPYLEYWTGFAEQTIEFGGMALIDYSETDVTVDDLPTTSLDYDYPGRAEDADWRQTAHDRIEQIRKTDVAVEVVDADGNPVEGATVDVAMREHDFGFGTAVAVNQLPDGNATYADTLLANFNKAVPENGLKVPAWEGRYGESLGPESTRDAIQWLSDHGVPTRGHALVWSTYDWMGIDSSLSDSDVNAEVQRLIEERATDFEGQLVEWDMHNHPLFYDEIWQDVGKDAMLDWWETANQADTSADMYLNEMNVLAGNSLEQEYHDLIQWLDDNGADVEGIGFMGHFDLASLTPPTELLARFDQFGQYGVPLQLTEFDVRINDRSNENEVATQRDYVRDVLTAAFSHEAVEGVMSWGFWPDEHWRPTAAYYDSDWTIRPHGAEYRRLVFEEWWSEVGGETNAQGVYADRVFDGSYRVTATKGQLRGRTTVDVGDDDGTVTIQVSPASIGSIDVESSEQVLMGAETTQLDVTLIDENGHELPVPDGAVSYESSNPDAVSVDGDGVASAAGTGESTVTATVTAYEDTAVGSVRLGAYGDPALADDCDDSSKVASTQNLSPVDYSSRHGDSTRFEKNDASQPGWATYHLPGGISSFRVVAYVNNQDISSDVFEDVVFEASTDGESWSEVAAESKAEVPASDANGFYAKWTYLNTSGVPESTTYLRVTIPENTATWATSLGEIDLWSGRVSVGERAERPVSELGDPTIDDPAEDFSKTASSSGMHITTGGSGRGETGSFEKDSASASGSVTYAVPDDADSFASFRVVSYVNFDEINGENDVFDDLVFETSSDAETFREVQAETKDTVAASGDNGFWAKWTYTSSYGLPRGTTHVRVSIPPTQNSWAVRVGEVDLWSTEASGGPIDATGPSIVIDQLQPGSRYELPHVADVSVGDAETAITDSSVVLDGDAWDGGELTARGRHVLSASATNAAGITTATDFDFELADATHDLVARQDPSATDVTEGDRVTFNVEDTTGNDRWVTDLQWDFGDGTTASGWWAAHRFESPGAYTVSLTATDNEGRTTTDAVVIWASDLDRLHAKARPSTTEASVGERITFDVQDTTGEGRWISDLQWDFDDGSTASGWWAEHRYEEAGTYTVALTATDQLGYATTHEVTIEVA